MRNGIGIRIRIKPKSRIENRESRIESQADLGLLHGHPGHRGGDGGGGGGGLVGEPADGAGATALTRWDGGKVGSGRNIGSDRWHRSACGDCDCAVAVL